ncbi:MAG TPA: hypothetical protein VFW40_14220 [Capsulimonadaceae bacterium]|nr:hypothetical protein [Capsulimonadaceae bacterium]
MKKILLPVILILALAGGAYVVIAHRVVPVQTSANSAAVPDRFMAIKVGMSQSQVLSMVGPPHQKDHYARYEHKPAAYWAQVEKEAAPAIVDQSIDSATPSLASIKAAAQLTHRYKDIWIYKPVPTLMMTLYFGDDGTLLDMGTAAAGGKGLPKGPGPSTPPSTAGHGAPARPSAPK